MELTVEMKALLDALKGVPAAVAEIKKRAEESQKANDSRFEKLQADLVAFAETGRLGAEGKFVAPISGNPLLGYQMAPAVDDRTPEQKAAEGDWDWTAFMRMVCLGSRLGGPEQAAKHLIPKGTRAWKDAGFTYEQTLLATQIKAMTYGTGTAGGYTVPEMQMATLVDKLRANMITYLLGADVWENLIGTVKYSRETTSTTGYWVGEAGAITDSDMVLDQPSLTPKEAAGMTKVSNSLLNWSNPKAAEYIQRNLAKTVGLLIDLAVFRGSGSSNQPTGIANTGSISTVAMGVNGATPTRAKLEEMLYKLELANSDQERVGFAMHPRSWSACRQWADSQSRPYFLSADGEVRQKIIKEIFGFPVETSTQIPITLTKGSNTDCSEIYLLNWPYIIIGEWGTLEVAASSETYDAFEKNMTWIRCLKLVDVGVKHPAACVYMADARGA